MLLGDELEAADISTRDGDTRQSKCQDLSNRDLKELPGRRVVSCPEASIPVASNETSPPDDKVASVLAPLEIRADLIDSVEAVVGCLVQVVAVKRPDFDGLLLLRRVRVTGPSIRIQEQAEWKAFLT